MSNKYEAEIEFPTANEAGEDVIYTIGVIEYYHQEPNPYADNDMDYYGYTDIEYDVLDEQGKILPVEEYRDCGEEIEDMVTEHFEEAARESCYD